MGLAVFIVLLVLVAIVCTLSRNEKKATIRVKDGNRVLSSATGSSPDEALEILFAKLYAQVQSLTKPEAIQSRIDQMCSAMDEARCMVSRKTIEHCSGMLAQAKEKHRRLSEENKLRMEEEIKIATEKQRLRKKEASVHKRMIAEQRRLMTDSLRYDILVRDGFRCKICGASAADGAKLHVDHILPVSKGGKTEKANLRTLCERCNLGKSNKIEFIPVPSASTQQIDPQLSASNRISEKDQDLPLGVVVGMLTASGIRYVDNTDRGGCFWIELTSESKTLLNGKTIDGRQIYIAKSSKAFSNAPAFFVK